MVMNVVRAEIASLCVFLNHASFSAKMTLGCFGKLICIAHLRRERAVGCGPRSCTLATDADKVARPLPPGRPPAAREAGPPLYFLTGFQVEAGRSFSSDSNCLCLASPALAGTVAFSSNTAPGRSREPDSSHVSVS